MDHCIAVDKVRTRRLVTVVQVRDVTASEDTGMLLSPYPALDLVTIWHALGPTLLKPGVETFYSSRYCWVNLREFVLITPKHFVDGLRVLWPAFVWKRRSAFTLSISETEPKSLRTLL